MPEFPCPPTSKNKRDPETKRKIVVGQFIRCFKDAEPDIMAEVREDGAGAGGPLQSKGFSACPYVAAGRRVKGQQPSPARRMKLSSDPSTVRTRSAANGIKVSDRVAPRSARHRDQLLEHPAPVLLGRRAAGPGYFLVISLRGASSALDPSPESTTLPGRTPAFREHISREARTPLCESYR